VTRVLVDDPASAASEAPVRRSRVVALVVVAVVSVVVVSAVHLTQGTSSVGTLDLLRLAVGDGEDRTAAVLVASRLPRLLAGALVGAALGMSGAALQSVARNPLASPDTLGVNAGAYLAVVAAGALGVSLPVVPSGLLAFAGGVLAAGLVLVLSAGGASGPTRLVLAGSAVAMALGALTTLLLILFTESTVGLFAWGSGSLVQSDLHAVTQMAPVVGAGALGLMLLAHRLDLLALGDDTASVLGVAVRGTRVAAVLLAVLLSAAAVTLAGPVGFVGLVAPVLVRLLGGLARELNQHRLLLPMSAVVGVLVVLTADVLLRVVLGGQGGVDIPTGVVTTLVGAVVLVWLARRFRDSGPTRHVPGLSGRRLPGRGTVAGIATASVLAVAAAVLLGMLAGDRWVLTGDLVSWLHGTTGRAMTYVLDARLPRVLAALLAGGALGLAGAVVQAVCRNPLAEPGIIGITGGAGVGAVLVITAVPAAGIWGVTGAAAVGAMAAFATVYLMSWRPGDRSGTGLASDRLVLIGVGVSAGAGAVTTFVILFTDPWSSTLALTWLSGSTFGRTLGQVVPVAVALAVVAPLSLHLRNDLDLLSLDDDLPRVLGVRLERTRLLALVAAALLTAAAVSAIGVVGFVGLVAPHVARTLLGSRHCRVLPLSLLLGAVLVSAADTIGRSVIAPAQIPAGLLTALLGAPYFVWLLWRSRDATGSTR
jgi:iron complex transport system permease protein